MQTSITKINGIFNRGRSLVIPFFQRGYVWTEDNNQAFLDSMRKLNWSSNDYFMGSIILKSFATPMADGVGDCRSVIDGQQRLTTIMIFFKVLADIKIEFGYNFYQNNFFNNVSQPILVSGHADSEVFGAIVNNQMLDERLKATYQHSNILKCYQFFTREDNLSVIKSLDPLALLSKISFVGIDLSRDEDEQQIFDTINSLGTRLTTAELLKNHLYNQNDIEVFSSTWKPTFERDIEYVDFWDRKYSAGRVTRSAIDMFLQSHFIIKAGNNDFLLSSLFKEYTKYIDDQGIVQNVRSKNEFIEDLMIYAELFRKLVDSEFLKVTMGTRDYLKRLNVIFFILDITTIIPYCLYVLRNVDSEEESCKIFAVLETYILRRSICGFESKDYQSIFTSAIHKKVLSDDTLMDFFKDQGVKNTYGMPTDTDMETAFAEGKWSNQKARAILYLLELAARESELQQTPLFGIADYELEHIMPRKWESNWPLPISKNNEDKELLIRKRENSIYNIGNLTILRGKLNRSIGNADWETKKNGRNNKKGLLVHGDGLITFSPYRDVAQWDEESIKNRSDALLQTALLIWPVS